MPRPVSATEAASLRDSGQAESGRYSLPQKRKCGNLVAAAETLPGCFRNDYNKIWFGFKRKHIRRGKIGKKSVGITRLSPCYFISHGRTDSMRSGCEATLRLVWL